MDHYKVHTVFSFQIKNGMIYTKASSIEIDIERTYNEIVRVKSVILHTVTLNYKSKVTSVLNFFRLCKL